MTLKNNLMALVPYSLALGFQELIEDIVEQSQFIFTLQDLTKTSPVFFIKTRDCCSRGFCRNVPRHIGIRRSCYIARSRIFA